MISSQFRSACKPVSKYLPFNLLPVRIRGIGGVLLNKSSLASLTTSEQLIRSAWPFLQLLERFQDTSMAPATPAMSSSLPCPFCQSNLSEQTALSGVPLKVFMAGSVIYSPTGPPPAQRPWPYHLSFSDRSLFAGLPVCPIESPHRWLREPNRPDASRALPA